LDPGTLVLLTVDRTFDPIINADPAAFSFDAMLARQLENASRDVSSAPDKLELVNVLAEALLNRGRHQEALIVINNAFASIRSRRSGAPPFVDLERSLNWAHDIRARILDIQGKRDESLAEMQEGSRASEDGRANISQTLNYASFLVHGRRPEEALKVLDSVPAGRGSRYGRSVARMLRVCAHAQQRDEERMRKALDELVAHAEDSLTMLREAAVCAGDLDLAAATFVRQLEHPVDRREALLSVQTFLGEEPGGRGIEPAVINRPQVLAAISRIARRETFGVYRVP
jgi:hypothetical protein